MDDAALYHELGPALERIGAQPVWERSLSVLSGMARDIRAWRRLLECARLLETLPDELPPPGGVEPR